jgi:hypothetical protein
MSSFVQGTAGEGESACDRCGMKFKAKRPWQRFCSSHHADLPSGIAGIRDSRNVTDRLEPIESKIDALKQL